MQSNYLFIFCFGNRLINSLDIICMFFSSISVNNIITCHNLGSTICVIIKTQLGTYVLAHVLISYDG